MKITSTTVLPVETHVTIFSDGSCPKNPGPMAIGYTLQLKCIRPGQTYSIETDAAGGIDNSKIKVGYQLIPGTNNRAEYHALIAALRHALRLCCTHATVHTDSQLIVKQITGAYRVTDYMMKRLRDEAAGLLAMFVTHELKHIPREENTEADFLSKNPTELDGPLPPFPLTETSQPGGEEPRYVKLPRRLSDQQIAMIKFWWATKRCQNEYRLSRIFGLTESFLGRIGRNEKYPSIGEESLPGSAKNVALTMMQAAANLEVQYDDTLSELSQTAG